MKNSFLKTLVLVACMSSLSFAASMSDKPFGSDKDVKYSQMLWMQLEKAKLNKIPATLYLGGPPHGPVREVLESTIDGKRVIIKRNYGGKDITIEKVEQNRAKYLKAVTVMIKKDGYYPKNNDWFWVKYKADGTLHQSPKKDALAGKVGGCIGCHNSASGNDLVFAHNKMANADITLVKEMEMMKDKKMMKKMK